MTDTNSGRLLWAEKLIVGYSKPLFSPLTFLVSASSLTTVVGSNGVGKTTLLKTILRLLPPLGGALGQTLTLRVGYVPQHNRIHNGFPILLKELVMLGRIRRIGMFKRPSKSDHEIVARSLSEVGLAHLAASPLHRLSGGQLQRALIARALASEPQLLVLDEPLNGMDMVARHDFFELILRLKEKMGLAVLVVSHDLASAASVSSQMILINGSDGSTLVGAPNEILTSQTLSKLFHRDVTAHWEEKDIVIHLGAKPGAPP